MDYKLMRIAEETQRITQVGSYEIDKTKIMLYRLKFDIAVDTLMEQHLVWDQDGTVGSNPAYGNIERCYSSNGNCSRVDSIAAFFYFAFYVCKEVDCRKSRACLWHCS